MEKKFKNNIAVVGSVPLRKAFTQELLGLGYKYRSCYTDDYEQYLYTSNFYNKQNGLVGNNDLDSITSKKAVLYNLPEDWDKALKLAAEVEEEIIVVPQYVRCTKDGLFTMLSDVKNGSIHKTDSTGYPKGMYRLTWEDGSGQMIDNSIKKYFVPATKQEYDDYQESIKKKELLAEANRRYPAGTTYITAGIGNDKFVVSKGNTAYYYSNYNEYIAMEDGKGLVYKNGEWAEIIEEELKVGDWYYQTEWQNIRPNYFQIIKIEGDLIWGNDNCGSSHSPKKKFLKVCRKATQEEVNSYTKANSDTIKILEYKSEFDGKTVNFGCKKGITKDDLLHIKAVQEFVNKYGLRIEFESKEDLSLSQGELSPEESVSITIIDKLIKKLS